MRERAFYYRGNRRLNPSRRDLAGTFWPLEKTQKEISMQRIRDGPLDTLDGVKMDYCAMIDRVFATKLHKEKICLPARRTSFLLLNLDY